jgi:hypothetical protein
MGPHPRQLRRRPGRWRRRVRPHSRDLYIPVGDPGFWQGAFRDLADSHYGAARRAIEGRGEWFVDILYGDHEGGQRVITRFRMQAVGEDKDTKDTWMASVTRHWNIDRPDPR